MNLLAILISIIIHVLIVASVYYANSEKESGNKVTKAVGVNTVIGTKMNIQMIVADIPTPLPPKPTPQRKVTAEKNTAKSTATSKPSALMTKAKMAIGFTKKEIRTEFNTEQKRVDKLLRLLEEDSIPPRLMKTQAIPLSQRTPVQVKLYKMTKTDQVKMLKELGVSDSDIENLTYEADRVKEIQRLQQNKKKSKKGYKNYLQQKQL